jgi:hypothetical protein
MRILNMREQLYFHRKIQLCSSMRLRDKNRAAPAILNAHRAALGASMMSLEQEKNAPELGISQWEFTSPLT